MTIRHKTLYTLVTGAILTASAIKYAQGERPLIVFVAALTFLFIGNLTVYLAGSRQRALRKQAKRDYYAGL